MLSELQRKRIEKMQWITPPSQTVVERWQRACRKVIENNKIKVRRQY